MRAGFEDLQIRPFSPNDRQVVEAFFGQMGGETRALFDRNGGNRSSALGFFEGKDQHTIRWMALAEERMVGYVYLWDINQGVPWLGLAVADDWKGKGLGGRLLQVAHDFARDKGKGGVLLTTHVANLRAQALYERCGYERIGIHTSGEVLYILRFR